MSAAVGHPQRLPWFADGRLDAAESADVERHLAGCAECRAEVDALRALYLDLRASAAGEHPTVKALVAHHEGRRSGDIETHVRRCPACASDLAALEHAGAWGRTRRTVAWLSAAAATLVVVVVGWQLAGRPEPALTHVVFPPSQRGTTSAPVLQGSGPWQLEIWPPPGAASAYVVRIERGGRPAATEFESPAVSSPDGKVLVTVSALDPGPHVLTLTSAGGDDPPVYVRSFEVVTRR